MAMLARLETYAEDLDRRSAHRRVLALPAPGITGPEGSVAVIIHDLSSTGLLIETAAVLAVGDTLEVELPEAGATVATIVWNRGRRYGCEFTSPLPKAVVSAALLKNPVQASELFDEHVEKFPPRVRLLIIVGLAIASWALVLSLAALIA